MKAPEDLSFEALTAEEKQKRLFLQQKKTLDEFLARGAISLGQYKTSYIKLRNKFGVDDKGNRR